MKECTQTMRNYDNYRVRFDTPIKKSKKLKRRKDDDGFEELRRIMRRNTDEQIKFTDIDSDNFSDIKALSKKKGIKAITSGKVLNAGRKKYRRWRKHDKKVIKERISPALQEMYECGDIGYKKAKKLRKIVSNRIISCFYGNDD